MNKLNIKLHMAIYHFINKFFWFFIFRNTKKMEPNSRKRKSYLYHGSSSKVPARTARHWNQEKESDQKQKYVNKFDTLQFLKLQFYN